MSKKFKSKRRMKFSKFAIIFFVILILFFSLKIFNDVNLEYWLIGDYTLLNINLNRSKILLKSALNYEETMLPSIELPVFNEEKNNLKIYIYNTHQTEEYVDFDVYNAALLLSEKLSSYNIDCIVESTDIEGELLKNDYSYSKSYRITRELLSKYLNNGYSLYIDLHRDSSDKDTTTAIIDGVSYAKIMFVVGGNHDNYMSNYNVADSLNKMIKEKNQELSRGIYTRMSSSYNQDLSENVLLIELGGPENTKEEVTNSLDILASIINDYLGV